MAISTSLTTQLYRSDTLGTTSTSTAAFTGTITNLSTSVTYYNVINTTLTSIGVNGFFIVNTDPAAYLMVRVNGIVVAVLGPTNGDGTPSNFCNLPGSTGQSIQVAITTLDAFINFYVITY